MNAVYTPSEVADVFKLKESEVLDELESGKLTGFKIAGKWRILEKTVNQLLELPSKATASKNIDVSELIAGETFEYRYPADTERYENVLKGQATFDSRKFSIMLGITHKKTYERDRNHLMVFIDGYPSTDFVKSDGGTWVTLVPGSHNPKGNLRPGDSIPGGFAIFTLKPMTELFKEKGVPNAMVATFDNTDRSAMIQYALLKARYKKRI